MSERTLQIIKATQARLRAAGRRLLIARVLTGLVATAGVAALWWFLATVAEALLWLPVWGRSTLVGVAALAVLSVLLAMVARPMLQLLGLSKRPSNEDVARKVEAVVPGARDRLVAFLDLSGGRHTASPQEIVEEALHSLFEPFGRSSFEPVETFSGFRRALKFSFPPLLALTVFIIAAPGPFTEASSRLLRPLSVFVRPAPFGLVVTPGDAEVVRGDSLSIQVTLTKPAEEIPVVEVRHDGERSDLVQTVRTQDRSSYGIVEPNVRRAFEYRALAGPVASPWYRIEVVSRPVILQLLVTIANPGYSRIGRTKLEPNVGDVIALRGSNVDVEMVTGGTQPAKADIVFDDGVRVPMTVAGDAASGRFRLSRAGSYHVELESGNGISNENPIEYRLQIIADAPPSVAIISPEVVEELSEPFQTRISARIMDDFGFKKLSLLYRRAESRFGVTSEVYQEIPVGIPSQSDLEQVVDHAWRVAESAGDIVPGDVIEYFLRVWDNDAFAGYKSADSKVQRLVMPSLAERYKEINETADDSADELENLIEKAQDVGERFRELRDELQRKPESDWDDERQLDQVRTMQQDLEQSIEDAASGLEELARQMKDNSLVSEETLDMFQQLQKAMAEINSPELMEALQMLRESMQNIDLPKMQQSMNDFEFNEEQFKERLQRALDLFKRLQVQQGLEEAARRAEELAELQKELRDATAELAEDKPSDEQHQEPDPEAASETEAAEEPAAESPTGDDSASENRDGAQQEAGDQKAKESTKKANESESESELSKREEIERLAGEQERSEAETRELEKRLEELQDLMNELKQNGSDALQDVREQLQRENLPQQMQDNAQQLRNEQMHPAMESQQQMQQQLSQLQQQLDQLRQNMQGNQLQLNIAGLRQVLNDILVLSQQQEAMRIAVAETETDSPALRQFARQQIELGEGLRVVSDTLQKLSREIPEMSREVQVETGQALREIGVATEALADRSARRASGHQKGSMMHLNELALLLSDLLNMLMNQQMGMGMPSMQQMLQQLQQMAGQQQQINDQIQQMLNDMQGQRLTSDTQARMRQLAEQQARIREQLKELSRNPELRGKALGDLDEIARQMEETIQELENSRVNRSSLERQQQILTRLLDASKSMNERGKENRRESRSGEELDRESPADLTPEERVNQLRRDLIRALESGYAPDYQELIRRYFKLLQESSEPEPADRP